MLSQSIKKELLGYVGRNIVSSLGLSLYIFIDTLFIALAAGTPGLAALNIALPIFNLFNCLGLLLGIGGATYYSLNKTRNPDLVRTTFSECLLTCILIAAVFVALLLTFTPQILTMLGASSSTLPLTTRYVKIIAWSAPLFACNYLCANFVRNDGNPALTLAAAMTETGVVLVADAVLVFGLNLHMDGAAIATVFAPLSSLIVLSFHRRFKGRTLTLTLTLPRLKTVKTAMRLGFANALTELSAGVSILVFNLVIERLTGTAGIAAYGVIANIAIISLALANGVALGIQPVVSREFGKRNFAAVKEALKLGLKWSLSLAAVAACVVIGFKYQVINIFNTDHAAGLEDLAAFGLPLYFSGLFFTSANLVLLMFFAAINQPKTAIALSFLRGYGILLPLIPLLGAALGMAGVWVATPITEGVITLLAVWRMKALLAPTALL